MTWTRGKRQSVSMAALPEHLTSCHSHAVRTSKSAGRPDLKVLFVVQIIQSAPSALGQNCSPLSADVGRSGEVVQYPKPEVHISIPDSRSRWIYESRLSVPRRVT
jgi:hypothetical protein